MLNTTPTPDTKSQTVENAPLDALKQIIDSYAKRFGLKFLKQPARLALLRETYVVAAGQDVNQDVVDALSGEEFEYKADAISKENLNILAENIAEVFPLLMYRDRLETSSDLGYAQPQDVTDFMVKLADIPAGVTVYNPFAGIASFAVALPDNPISGEEIHRTLWAIAQINIFANGVRANILNEDSFKGLESGKKYDAIIANPPYLSERGRRIEDVVAKLYDKLTDNGRLICIVPHSMLSNQAGATLRKRLITDKSIKAVVTLPDDIFPNTRITQDVLFIQKGEDNDSVIFADASGYTRFSNSLYRSTLFEWEQFMYDLEWDVSDHETGREIRIENDETDTPYLYITEGDIAAPFDYSELYGSDLTPAAYLVPQPIISKPLVDIFEEVMPQHGYASEADEYIRLDDIPEKMHLKPYTPVAATGVNAQGKADLFTIDDDVVIMTAAKGQVRTVYTQGYRGTLGTLKGLVKVFKPKGGVSAQYLAAALTVKVVNNQIMAQMSGHVLFPLNRLSLDRIFIPLSRRQDEISAEEQERMILHVVSSEMTDLELELQDTVERQRREIRSTRHAMIQTLSALSSNWEQLRMFAKLRDGKLNLSDNIGRVNPITVENLMGSIGYAISTLERQVEALRFEREDWGEEVEINPYKFVNDYIATHSTPEVRMTNIGDETVNTFYAPERLLERIFNNIVANAKAHGFSTGSTDSEIRFDWYAEKGCIIITIANNGAPLKEGVTGDDVLMSGFSTALNESSDEGTLHSGQGGYEIKSLMESLGTVEVLSEPAAEYPVTYRLTFERTNFVNLDTEE